MSETDELVQLKIRVPADVMQRIRLSAALNFRTVSGEVNYVLSAAYGPGLTEEEKATLAQASDIVSAKFGKTTE